MPIYCYSLEVKFNHDEPKLREQQKKLLFLSTY